MGLLIILTHCIAFFLQKVWFLRLYLVWGIGHLYFFAKEKLMNVVECLSELPFNLCYVYVAAFFLFHIYSYYHFTVTERRSEPKVWIYETIDERSDIENTTQNDRKCWLIIEEFLWAVECDEINKIRCV